VLLLPLAGLPRENLDEQRVAAQRRWQTVGNSRSKARTGRRRKRKISRLDPFVLADSLRRKTGRGKAGRFAQSTVPSVGRGETQARPRFDVGQNTPSRATIQALF